MTPRINLQTSRFGTVLTFDRNLKRCFCKWAGECHDPRSWGGTPSEIVSEIRLDIVSSHHFILRDEWQH